MQSSLHQLRKSRVSVRALSTFTAERLLAQGRARGQRESFFFVTLAYKVVTVNERHVIYVYTLPQYAIEEKKRKTTGTVLAQYIDDYSYEMAI